MLTIVEIDLFFIQKSIFKVSILGHYQHCFKERSNDMSMDILVDEHDESHIKSCENTVHE